MSNKPIIIIGTGLAGYNLAKEWRKHETEQPLLLFTQDDGGFYSKPQLSLIHAQSKQPNDLIMQSAEAMAASLNATVHTHTTVEAIHPEQHRITTTHGDFEYDKLVLAIGASTRNHPSEATAHAIPSVNSLSDYRGFFQSLQTKSTVAIIGSGLVGLEFATDLAKSGKKVTVFSTDAKPLCFLPDSVSETIQQFMEEQGIAFHLSESIDSIAEEQGAYQLHSDKATYSFDYVLKAIGLAPNCSLAKTAGLSCDKGILVNALLETSAPDIYALGDVAELCFSDTHRDHRAYVKPLMIQAAALAKTLSGEQTTVEYPPLAINIKLAKPLSVYMAHPKTDYHRIETEGSYPNLQWRFYNEAAELMGFALLGMEVRHKDALLVQIKH